MYYLVNNVSAQHVQNDEKLKKKTVKIHLIDWNHEISFRMNNALFLKTRKL